jgi:class 3 adenylate cyclase
MQPRGNRTFICSVLFLDIAGYSEQPVAEQIRLKERFNALVAEALAGVAAADRIILDTGDGAAISFIGDPEDALTVAGHLRDALQAPPGEAVPLRVRLGINLGPVKLVRDINGQPNIIGDGINVAQRVMSFAEPGQVTVSRSYFEVVSRISDGYARMFDYQGVRTDKHVRAHEVYTLTAAPGTALPRTAQPAAADEDVLEFRAQRAAAAAADAAPRPSRRLRVGLPLAVVAIVGGALLVRVLREGAPPAAPSQETAVERPAPPAAERVPGPIPLPPPPAVAEPAPAPPPTTATPAPAQAAASPPAPAEGAAIKPATLEFAIAPWGEVYVNGELQGVSPPLQRLEVPPGAHRIEVRNANLPVYRQTVQVESGERARIRHKFR